MKISAFLLLFSLVSGVPEISWQKDAALEIDIDCDGETEELNVGFIENDFVLKMSPSSVNSSSQLQFGLGQASRQDAICDVEVEFLVTDSIPKQIHINMFGETVEGYNYDSSCKDLVVLGGDCDSITIFYNHKTEVLNWWRL